MARFGLDAGTYLTINATGGGTYTHLPLGEPAPLLGILGACVELQDVAKCNDLAVLARYATDPDEAAELLTMSGRAAIASEWEPVGGRCSSWATLSQHRPAIQCVLGIAAVYAASLLLHFLLPRRNQHMPSHGRRTPWPRP